MNSKKEILMSQSINEIISKNNQYLIIKAKHGTSKLTQVPLKISEELVFFVATIIGDGHLRSSKTQINIEVNDKNIVLILKKICYQLFNREFNIRSRIENHKGIRERFKLTISSKPIYNLLKITFGIPSGKKSNIVDVPNLIKNTNNNIKSAFLLGIMITEGGNRKRGYGLSTSSKKLWESIINLFYDLDIEIKTDRWIYKKYNKEYYGLYFKKEQMKKIIKLCKNKEIIKLLESKFR